jgi:hypothetical protein
MASLFVLLSGCMVWENDVGGASGLCGAKETRAAGEYCNCDSDCAASAEDGFCLDEAAWGNPRGECIQNCRHDVDCGSEFVCLREICRPTCSTTSDCVVGRSCSSTGRVDVRVCVSFCDEDSDCDSGVCNLHSHDCLSPGATPQGLGLNAACDVEADCLSNNCQDGICVSTCDPEFQRCPEGAHCGDDSRCELLCDLCDGDAQCDSGDAAACLGAGDA